MCVKHQQYVWPIDRMKGTSEKTVCGFHFNDCNAEGPVGNELMREVVRSRKFVHFTEAKPYIQRIPRLKSFIPKNGQIHRSLEFAFDSGKFVRNPSKIIAKFDQGLYWLVDSRHTVEAKFDSG